MPRPTVAIIGAGITGLVTGLRLKERGADVLLLEASDREGGPIQSTRREGYRLERGPHTLLEKNLSTARLVRDLGLDDQRVEASEEANKRFVVRDQNLLPIPMSPGQFIETDLLSWPAKLRLLGEPFVPPLEDDRIDESLANFIRRRLGDEVLEYAVGPFVGGIYAGKPRLLSARHAFERMHRLEREHGSLFKGMLHRVLGGEDEEGPSPSRRLFSFKEGSGQMIDRLVERLDDQIRRDFSVARLRADSDGGWRVAAEDGRSVGPVDEVIWTAPAYALGGLELVGDADEAEPLDLFEEVTYPPVAVVATGWERYRIGHPLDGFGFLVPESEPNRVLGTLFMSSLFPNRAPAGRTLLSTFVGGSRAPQMAHLSDRAITDAVRHDLEGLLEARGAPEMVDIYRWERAIPQYEVGYGRILERLDTIERRHPGVHFTGSFRDGIAVPDLIAAADETASSVMAGYTE